MDELISCPRCERKLKVPEAVLGAEVKCPMCDLTFVAAPAHPASEKRPPARVDEDDEPLRPGGARQRPYRRLDDYDDPEDERPIRRRHRGTYTEGHRGAVVLTLGILGLVMFWCCLAGWILGGLAWSMGSTDLQKMESGYMDPTGQGITRAGQVCGIIAVILSTLVFCLQLANLR